MCFCILANEDKKGGDLDGSQGQEELQGTDSRETVITSYCVRERNLFSVRGNN